MMIKEDIIGTLRSALERAVQSQALQPVDPMPEIDLSATKSRLHGDYASNLALVLAPRLKMPPREVARILVKHIDVEKPQGCIEKVEIAGPGFLNFTLVKKWLSDIVTRVVDKGAEYGKSNRGAGKRVQVEFVSANPNGPITVAHGRGGAIGDSIASMLQATGYRVEREFYVNDALNSTQMVNFGRSVHFRYLQLLGKDVGYTDDAHLPDWLYRGDYVTDIARRIIEKIGDRYAQTLLGDPDLINVFRLLAQEGMQAQQDGDLTAFGIKFDRWFNESTLHESGEVKAAIDDLTKKGLTYESDGAIWLKSTLFNDDKDRVLMRANGTATYIAGDLAYHRDKFKRGYDLVIDVWGADHGGYVARTKAAVEASGVDPARLEILLFQLVRISKNGELVLSSKRRGNVLELKADLIDEIGIDAARFFFLMRSADGPLDIDLELAREQSNKNPVFYVQYAHARACTVFAKATADYGITVMADPEAKLELLTLETEKDLIRKIGDWPDELEYAASHRAPHLITQYLRDLAALFHTNYDAGNNDPSARMLCDDKELRSARLYLTFAVRTVIANALNVLGLSAPETM